MSLKAAKNRFQLSTGSNLETLNTISSGTNLCLSRVSNLNLNSASDLIYFSWKYLCVDEGHRLKNIDCRLVRELKKYNSDHRYIVLYSVQRTAYSVQRKAYSVQRTACSVQGIAYRVRSSIYLSIYLDLSIYLYLSFYSSIYLDCCWPEPLYRIIYVNCFPFSTSYYRKYLIM